MTIASPRDTTPSNGITFPMRTTTRSSGSICFVGTRISCSSLKSQTFPTFRDMSRARSPTDFLCVHSSSNSPMPSRNMIELAVFISLRRMETPIAVASRAATSSLPFFRLAIPCCRYFRERTPVQTARTCAGIRSFPPKRITTFMSSFS